MATVLPNGYGIWKPTFTLDGSSKIFQTVLMFKNDLENPPEPCNDSIRTIFVAAGRPFNAASMYIGYTLASTECYVNVDGDVLYDINETAVVGTRAGSLGSPINTSLLMKKNTGLVGRRYQGRFMLPNMYVPEADISQPGIILEATRVAYQAIWNAAITDVNTGADFTTVLGHSSSEVLPTPYTTVTLQPKIGTIRRRIRGY